MSETMLKDDARPGSIAQWLRGDCKPVQMAPFRLGLPTNRGVGNRLVGRSAKVTESSVPFSFRTI